MKYNLDNPSDPYTLSVEDFDVATVACFLLGGGRYGPTADAEIETLRLTQERLEYEQYLTVKAQRASSSDCSAAIRYCGAVIRNKRGEEAN